MLTHVFGVFSCVRTWVWVWVWVLVFCFGLGLLLSVCAHGLRCVSARARVCAWAGGGAPAGDSIPVSTGLAVLVPLVQPDGTLAPDILHAYVASSQQPDDPACPLFSATGFTGANNTALGNWAGHALASFELDPSLPELAGVRCPCTTLCGVGVGWVRRCEACPGGGAGPRQVPGTAHFAALLPALGFAVHTAR
jgi:hypothetical protein